MARAGGRGSKGDPELHAVMRRAGNRARRAAKPVRIPETLEELNLGIIYGD